MAPCRTAVEPRRARKVHGAPGGRLALAGGVSPRSAPHAGSRTSAMTTPPRMALVVRLGLLVAGVPALSVGAAQTPPGTSSASPVIVAAMSCRQLAAEDFSRLADVELHLTSA